LFSCKKDDPFLLPEMGSFTDPRDGHTYKTVEIGTQTWFVENLSYEVAGKEITASSVWNSNVEYDGWCYYENDKATYGATYGILYQWEVAKDNCPDGWHVPTNADWTKLADYLGGFGIAGEKLKERGTSHWTSPNDNATNETGFTALPGGIRHYDGFGYLGDLGSWWASTDMENTELADFRDMNYDSKTLGEITNLTSKYNGFSVRCLKD